MQNIWSWTVTLKELREMIRGVIGLDKEGGGGQEWQRSLQIGRWSDIVITVQVFHVIFCNLDTNFIWHGEIFAQDLISPSQVDTPFHLFVHLWHRHPYFWFWKQWLWWFPYLWFTLNDWQFYSLVPSAFLQLLTKHCSLTTNHSTHNIFLRVYRLNTQMQYAIKQWCPILFLDFYLHVEFRSNPDRTLLSAIIKCFWRSKLADSVVFDQG